MLAHQTSGAEVKGSNPTMIMRALKFYTDSKKVKIYHNENVTKKGLGRKKINKLV